MSLVEKQQRNSSTQSKIAGVLIQLRGSLGMSNGYIAKKIGVGESYLSGVFKGRTQSDSTQLLAGLELLKELEMLKRSPKPKPLEAQIEELRQELRAIQSGKYPPHRASAQGMNESPNSISPSPEEDAGQIVDDFEKPGGRGGF